MANSKMVNDDVLEYDDNEAIDYIYDFLDKDDRKLISKDDILFVLAMMGEYYEEKGLISESEDADDEVVNEAEIDEDEIFQYIMQRVQEDDTMSHLTGDLVDQILEGEYNYGLSTGIYEQEEE